MLHDYNELYKNRLYINEIKEDQKSLQKVIRNSLVLMRPSYRINLGLNEKVRYAAFEADFNVFPERIHPPQACEGISPKIGGR